MKKRKKIVLLFRFWSPKCLKMPKSTVFAILASKNRFSHVTEIGRRPRNLFACRQVQSVRSTKIIVPELPI
jgi:hypothetical protein